MKRKPAAPARPRNKTTDKASKRKPAVSLRPDAAVQAEGAQELGVDLRADRLIHAAAVKAGAGACMHYVLKRLPLLHPFLPAGVRRQSDALREDKVQVRLVREIYALHAMKPARWELEGVLAVARSQGGLSPLATRAGVQAMIAMWLPRQIVNPLLRFTPIEPLVTHTARAVSTTWAAGRYADNVCKLRRVGADWLPAPISEAMRLAPSKLREWSAEALSLAIPPMRLAQDWLHSRSED